MITKMALKTTFLFIVSLVSFTFTQAQLNADFIATPTSGCSPLLVRFTDKSAGNPTSWKWDLGNGTISFLRNPSVIYFNPGKYTIKLVAKTSGNEDSVVKVEYIEVLDKPIVQFGAANTTGCFPLPVQFFDSTILSNSNITSWLWDFGDGIISSLKNPLHTYTTAGNFNVSLRINNSSGCLSTITKTSFIQINTGVLAKFTNNTPSNCNAPVTINFQNQSTGTGTISYQWSFGDGTNATDSNPTHVYSAAGSYSVRLIVTNGNGCADTIIKPNSISIGQVRASFSAPDSACPNNSIQFSNTSLPSPTSVTWSFGDGSFSSQINAIKAYTVPGIYSVKMLANFGVCKDSAIKSIRILPKVIVKFIADDTTNCKAPFVVNFTNQSINGVSYLWQFGDGATSNLENPNHTYNTQGSYTVKLKITNTNGCTDSLIKNNYIVAKKPVISFKNLPDSNCAPFTKSFSANINTVDPVTSFLWNFGDGNTSTNATTTNTYSAAGIYPISLIITTAGGCTDSAGITRGVIVNDRPLANFSATPTNTCANTAINFSDLTTPAASAWLWNFGNGVTSSTKNPIYQYNDTGYFDITLIASNRGCRDTVKFTKYIHISPPVAKYLVSNNCANPYEKVFTDQSKGADEWYWDFGDGNTSTIKNPVHVYTSTGTFNSSLRVVNSASGCDYTAFKTVQVIDVSSKFIASDTTVCKGTTINFITNLSLSEVSNFSWNFGDASLPVSSIKNTINYTYTKAGSYTVTLIITNLLGCKDTLVKTNYISVNGPTAKFGTSVKGTCLKSLVNFSDSSISDGIHPIETWVWNYGDNTIDTLASAPFQHTYLTSGSYLVKLKITDNQGCADSAKLSNNIIVSQPMAKFNTADSLTCPGKQIQIKDQSTGLNLLYQWNFGDNTAIANTQNPFHIYNSDGSYSVKLKVTDQYGCEDSITKTSFVKIATPVSLFFMSDSVSSCPPLIVNFTDSSSNVVSNVWDFGDNTFANNKSPVHFYSYPGTFNVKLTVTSAGGCTDVFQRQINISGPRGSFTYKPINGCKPLLVNFTATVFDNPSIIWDFNDGAIESSPDTAISYTYTFPGSYIPKMILVDQNGCQVPIRGKDTIVVNSVSTNFSFLRKPLCDSGNVSFKDSSISNDAITGYQWDFGDGKTSSLKNPFHFYNSTGLNYPSLIVTTLHGCTDTLKSTLPIKIVASPQIATVASANGCVPLKVTFSSGQVVQDTSSISWKWDFANGNTSTISTPVVQNYTGAGVYSILLVATNSSGCTDTTVTNIEAYGIPVVDAGPDSIILCQGSSITLNATGALNYSWLPATGLSCSNCANPSSSISSDLKYVVTGTTVYGCSAKDTIVVNVKNKFAFTYSKSDSVCKGVSKKLTAAGANNYNWTPTVNVDNPLSSTPTVQPDTTTLYRVIAGDNVGCFKDTGYINIRVNPIPTVEAGLDKTINVGQVYDLVPTISPDVIYVDWQPTTGLFRNVYPGITVKPTENTEYNVLVKNKGGCAARDRVNVIVICNGANVFMPNTFSPNDDGINDVFYPRGTGLFKVKTLQIFSRWGELVFEKNSFNANDAGFGWNGTFKGLKLNPEVFVYSIEIICENNSVLVYRGNIALVK